MGLKKNTSCGAYYLGDLINPNLIEKLNNSESIIKKYDDTYKNLRNSKRNCDTKEQEYKNSKKNEKQKEAKKKKLTEAKNDLDKKKIEFRNAKEKLIEELIKLAPSSNLSDLKSKLEFKLK